MPLHSRRVGENIGKVPYYIGVKTLITGAAGFIGSNLVDRLLADGHEVIGIDNLQVGSIRNLQQASTNPNFSFYQINGNFCRYIG